MLPSTLRFCGSRLAQRRHRHVVWLQRPGVLGGDLPKLNFGLGWLFLLELSPGTQGPQAGWWGTMRHEGWRCTRWEKVPSEKVGGIQEVSGGRILELYVTRQCISSLAMIFISSRPVPSSPPPFRPKSAGPEAS